MKTYTKPRNFGSLTTADEPASSKIHIDPRLVARGLRNDAPFIATIRVTPGHVPDYVTVRETISPRILTAQVHPSALEKLERDKDVISVSSAQPIRRMS